MRGARGEAQANEWPGAMIPALPELASRPSPSLSSRIVTSWPALARKYAVVTPTTPPPSTSVFMGSRLEKESGSYRIFGIEEELAEAREVRGAGDLRQDRTPAVDDGLTRDAAREVEAQEPTARDAGARAHEPAMVEERHARAGPRSARRRVDLPRPPYERIRRHAGRVRQLVHEDVVDAGLAEPGHGHRELSVDGLAHRHAPLGDPAGELAPHAESQLCGLDDREHVADPDGDVDGHLADRFDLDALPGEHDERRRPAQGDFANTIAVGARDGLDDARLRVDDHRRLVAGAPHHARFDRHRRGADGALAARDVVAAGVDEEEAEVSPRRDRLGHHGDEETAVAARLEAEAGAQILVVLLEIASLLADGGARQRTEPAGEQAHTDPRGVKVDGRDDSIGAHRHLAIALHDVCGRQRPRGNHTADVFTRERREPTSASTATP